MVKILCAFLFVCVSLQTVFCGSEYSSITAAANNVTGTPTVEFNTGVEDYLPAFLEPPECGWSLSSTKRVVGGESAELGEYPWMALLGYHTRRGHVWNCGGSLFSMRHVLTAAHCIYNREKSLYVVRLGELDYAREDDGAIPIDFLIKKMFVHEEYDPNTSSNDIGILILQKDVEFTRLIRPICIPHNKWRQETFENYYAVIGGWGRTSYRGIPASHLQFVRLPIRSNSVCAEAFQKYKGRVIDGSVICGGYDKGGMDSCSGDSGGPLMLLLGDYDKSGYFVTGVISYGLQCGFFSIYTRVTHFVPWIEEKVLGHITSSP